MYVKRDTSKLIINTVTGTGMGVHLDYIWNAKMLYDGVVDVSTCNP